MHEPRTAIVSFRRVCPHPWLANLMAMETLATSAFGADVYHVVPASGAAGRRLSHRGRLRHAAAVAGLPAFRLEPRPPAGRTYDLLIVLANDFTQVSLLDGVHAFGRMARTQVLLQTEIWLTDLTGPGFQRLRDSVLDRFDIVFSALESSLESLREALPGQVHPLALSVDTSVFTDRPGPRPVAVTSLGRRDAGQHRAIHRWAEAGGRWYFYDATPPGPVVSFPEHLEQFGQLLQRSRVWVANRARFYDVSKHKGRDEIGLRFYEGLAGGCAMLGDFPDSPGFRTTFGDLPGMIPMPSGADRIPDEMDRLVHDDRIAERVARSHQARALRTCDIAHRLRTIAETAGLPVPELVRDRIRGLDSRAADLAG